MPYFTTVTIPMYTKIAVPAVLNLKQWKESFFKYSQKLKKEEYKVYFVKCYELVKLSIICRAQRLIVKSDKNSLDFIFTFGSEESMNKFVKLLQDNDIYKL